MVSPALPENLSTSQQGRLRKMAQFKEFYGDYQSMPSGRKRWYSKARNSVAKELNIPIDEVERMVSKARKGVTSAVPRATVKQLASGEAASKTAVREMAEREGKFEIPTEDTREIIGKDEIGQLESGNIKPLKGRIPDFIGRFYAPSEQAVKYTALKNLTKALKVAKKDVPPKAEIEAAKSQKRSRDVAEYEKRMEGIGEVGTLEEFADVKRKASGALGGRLPAWEVNPEVLRNAVGDDGYLALSKVLRAASDKNKGVLRPYDGKNALESFEALMETGKIPTPADMRHLTTVFGNEFGEAIVRARPRTIFNTGYTPGELLIDLLSTPRAALSSVDLSFLLRQGGMMFPREAAKVKRAARVAVTSIKSGGSEVSIGLENAMRQVDDGNLWKLYVDDGGLFIHKTGSQGVERLAGAREEAFMSTLAGKTPVVGGAIRASERAYTTFLNKLRWDVMDDFVKRYEGGLGRKIDTVKNPEDLEFVQGMARYINAMTGRGPGLKGVPFIGGSARTVDIVERLMNALLFSPKLFTSRIFAPIEATRLIKSGIPGLYPEAVRGSARARQVYSDMSWRVAQQMASWFAAGTTLLALAKFGLPHINSDSNVELDPRSADFGKIRIGKNRYDVWAGYTPIARAIAMTATGEIKSTSTGEIRPIPKGEVLSRFVRSKFSPTFGAVIDYNLIPAISEGEKFGTGVGFLGEDRDIIKDMQNPPMRLIEGIPVIDQESFWSRYLVPLFIRDLSAAVAEELTPITALDASSRGSSEKDPPSLISAVKGVGLGALQSIPAIGGIGLATYETLDDIAKDMTRDEPGGPKRYSELMSYQRREAQDIRKAREAGEGRTRTTGYGNALDNLRNEETQEYIDMERRLLNRQLTSREIRQQFFDVKNEYRIRRAALFSEYFKDEEEVRTTRNPYEQEVEDFYSRVKEIEERRRLTFDQFNDLLISWETEMRMQGKFPAVTAMRMMENQAKIPQRLLEVLPSSTRVRYQGSNELRRRHKQGTLGVPQLYNR